MNVLSSSWDCSFRGAEWQRFGMRKFISKYEQRMITIKEHQIHDMDNSPLYSRKESCAITK
jgi:hypothetical protein